MSEVYAIKFDFPDSDVSLYAGMHKGALGWAPTLATALLFKTREEAGRNLANGYGASTQYGTIVEVTTNEVVA